ncbi:MAG: PIN domain-containing protein [Rhodocyclaceae bacterium]|nr:PIN domain-containing protein [Rhodocyclaceae bacterium]
MSADLSSDGVTVVLDTNVLISLYVFADSQFAPLRNHIEAGRWQVVTNEACLAEFVRVLNYPLFRLGAEAQTAAIAAYQNVARGHRTGAIRLSFATALHRRGRSEILELARDSQAAFLITSDQALLG